MQPVVSRILVADDNAALARVIAFNLERCGYRVDVASNGRIAYQMATANSYDLIITDQQMPEVSGVELCELLRARAEYRTLPIVMLTAKGLELELTRLRDELGVVDVLPKPFSPSHVVALVKQLLSATSSCLSRPKGQVAES